jgi:adenylate cyclase
MVAIILRNGGFLDKFIGDAIMAVFGIPFNEEKHPEIAVKVAVEMQSKLKELNDSKSFGEFQLSMTVGIHTGNIIAGNLGSKERMDYTVIGDTVNLASRIQSLNKTYFSDILISDSTHKSLLNYKNICVREIDTVKVKGRNKPCILYEVIHISNINSYNHKIKTLEIFSSAIILYKSGDFIASKNLFLTLIDNDSNDPLPGIYLERIENLLKNPPFNWSGIYEHLNK